MLITNIIKSEIICICSNLSIVFFIMCVRTTCQIIIKKETEKDKKETSSVNSIKMWTISLTHSNSQNLRTVSNLMTGQLNVCSD